MIIAVVGPTGVGKTKLSVELAKHYHGIIVNCDAMQVYKKMDIGTAKVTEKEKENIPHDLLDIKDANENYTVYDYQIDARKIIEENQNKNIIFVGGTGLYLKAALYSYEFSKEEKETNNYEGRSNEELYALAIKKDPYMDIHVNNRKRLVRFLNKEKTNVPPSKPLYDAIYIGLTCKRDELYERINKRVDEMFEQGLLEEVKGFYDAHIYSKALKTAIGYKELYSYFDGDITLEEARELIKKRSRNYAKRQYTWFNNQMNIKWFDVNFKDFNKTVEEVIKYIG